MLSQRYWLLDRASEDSVTLLSDDCGRVHLRIRVDGASTTLVLVRHAEVEELAHALLSLAREETP